ncbi:hypothetical protein [Trichloromonas sp.]|uniref:hypothetical protein n=1 Tax=Trichloromonas sp. TaxID=3069249 RepID=UPI002A4958D7|nr:hypothetical protein [Trichloromonas sp.]
MNLLDLVQKHVPLRRVSGNKGGEWHGPCPACGTSQADPSKSDRFVVWPEIGGWMCRNCGAGDAIEFLRKFEGMTCPEAHEALGKVCESTTCPVRDKCRMARDRVRAAAHVPDLTAPKIKRPVVTSWQAAEATGPVNTWRGKAAAMVEWCHHRLLGNREQLDYLASRGLSVEAVKKFRLGWNPEDLYRARSAWGLPEEISTKTGKPKKLWIPKGIVIPYFDAVGVHRLQIRQPEGEPRYYWLPGSGDDVLIIGDHTAACVVVESALDALLIAWQAGDVAAALPLGTCNARPKQTAAAILRKSLCILVALDFEPRENPKTGKIENPGGHAAQWWTTTFSQSVRWPVPSGKDPGEYHQTGGDVRAWIIAGLPPGLRPKTSPPAPATAEPAAPAPAAETIRTGQVFEGQTKSGRAYLLAENALDVPELLETFPGKAVITSRELKKLVGATPEEAEAVLMIKEIFPGAVVHDRRTLPTD